MSTVSEDSTPDGQSHSSTTHAQEEEIPQPPPEDVWNPPDSEEEWDSRSRAASDDDGEDESSVRSQEEDESNTKTGSVEATHPTLEQARSNLRTLSYVEMADEELGDGQARSFDSRRPRGRLASLDLPTIPEDEVSRESSVVRSVQCNESDSG
ncbi:hypothetical protein BD324DRAFT_653151 [Kockovaella imperatae]|uniref:Uncharacterized protein n=1 Tax=Kockovaella imperatae TaxID=4999 RepID=A0A1Y1U8L9_9TREE|nr:hypothetical protein BD324DRAFT_653151 [Kockovaella imperatae]ORX34373.1 hypothetical protein BD324DRAFT_653151 [Kockovaella imperatae]